MAIFRDSNRREHRHHGDEFPNLGILGVQKDTSSRNGEEKRERERETHISTGRPSLKGVEKPRIEKRESPGQADCRQVVSKGEIKKYQENEVPVSSKKEGLSRGGGPSKPGPSRGEKG